MESTPPFGSPAKSPSDLKYSEKTSVKRNLGSIIQIRSLCFLNHQCQERKKRAEKQILTGDDIDMMQCVILGWFMHQQIHFTTWKIIGTIGGIEVRFVDKVV